MSARAAKNRPATSPQRGEKGAKPKGPNSTRATRAFESAWAGLEKMHAWRIHEEEVHNPPIATSRLPWAWQDIDSSVAAAFRERHRLQDLVAGAADDWEALLRLRHWTYRTVRDGSPAFPIEATDPATFVETSLAGAPYYCTYFGYAFVAAAACLGHTARHLGIDCEHTAEEGSCHHGVADVWVNKFRKWVAFDPHHDSHHELNGVPLNAEELGLHWRKKKGAGIVTRVGTDGEVVERARHCRGDKHEICGYFWHYIDCENDVFHRRKQHWPNPVVFLVDEERKRQTWYQGKGATAFKHGRYTNGSFVTTERYEDAYPDLNCTNLIIKPLISSLPHKCLLSFGGTCVPNFSHYSARIDGQPAVRIDGVEYPWRLRPGTCSLEVRAVNRAGIEGPPSRVILRIEADRSRKPAWPATVR